ncbi:MAG TPA: VanW family protein [Mycobacteriales bacterium]|nr:VanW family protein [Mycobacteriales bacterium]
MSSTVLPDAGISAVSRPSRVRTAAAVAAVGIGVLGLVYAADVAFARDQVPRGVRIAGVELGGRSAEEAHRLLARAVADDAVAPIAVSVDGTPAAVEPARAGLSVDVAATLDRASAQALNPFSRVRSFFSTRDVDVVTRVDESALRVEMTRLAKQFDRRPREGAVRFDGTTPVEILPVTGITLDVDAAAADVYDAYLDSAHGTAPVGLPAAVVPVRSTADDVRRIALSVAAPAVSGPVLLRSPVGVLSLPPLAIAKSFVAEADDAGRIVPTIDGKLLDAVFGSVLARAEVPAKDAEFVFNGPVISIRPSASGRDVDLMVLAERLLPALSLQGELRTVDLPIVASQPKVTTARAQSLGIKEIIGQGTTFYPCCRPRVNNIHRMSEIVDGAVVLPGETFSLNGHVGPRDRARGFVPAPMILDGEFVDSVGGGVSQFATTMFNAVFFSGLKDIYHKPHSYYISRYPPGREATVSHPAPDLKWQNDSPHGVVVKTSFTPTSVTVTLWGTKQYDAVEAVTGARTRFRGVTTEYRSGRGCEGRGGAAGFDIVVTRVFKKAGKEIRRERFFTRYLMETRIVCRRASRPAPASSPTP